MSLEKYDAMDEVANNYQVENTFDGKLMKYKWKEIVKHFGSSSSCIEIGCADGLMTELLCENFNDVFTIEPSRQNLDMVKRRLSNKKFTNWKYINSFVEDFNIDDLPFQPDIIIISHVLEHVDDPIKFLKRVMSFAKITTKIILTVPNAFSFHRLYGLEMGLLNNLTDFSPADRRLKHQRVYSEITLRNDLISSGLEIKKMSTYFIKILTAKDSEKLSNEQIEGLYKLSKHFPKNGSTILSVCQPLKT